MDDSDNSADSDFEISEEDSDFSGDGSDFDIDSDLESDNYDSDSSEASFVGQETREQAARNDFALILSKDETIQYSLEPPPTARPPASHGQSTQNGNSKNMHNCS